MESHAAPVFTCEYELIPYMSFWANCLLIHTLRMTAALLKILQKKKPNLIHKTFINRFPYEACFSRLLTLNLVPMETFNVIGTSCFRSGGWEGVILCLAFEISNIFSDPFFPCISDTCLLLSLPFSSLSCVTLYLTLVGWHSKH